MSDNSTRHVCGTPWEISSGPGRTVGPIARSILGILVPLPDDFEFEYCPRCAARNMTPELEARFLEVEKRALECRDSNAADSNTTALLDVDRAIAPPRNIIKAEHERLDDSALPPGNWPPSRGPEPEWMTRKPEYVFPEPQLIDEQATLTELGFPPHPLDTKDDEEPSEQRWMSVSAYVTDLIETPPRTCHSLVVASDIFVPKMRGDKNYNEMHARAISHIEPRPLVAVLDYPLRVRVGVRVVPFVARYQAGDEQRLMSIGWLLWSLARAYELIYAKHEKYGIWGHSIRDLVFELLAIDGERAYVSVGS